MSIHTASHPLHGNSEKGRQEETQGTGAGLCAGCIANVGTCGRKTYMADCWGRSSKSDSQFKRNDVGFVRRRTAWEGRAVATRCHSSAAQFMGGAALGEQRSSVLCLQESHRRVKYGDDVLSCISCNDEVLGHKSRIGKIRYYCSGPDQCY